MGPVCPAGVTSDSGEPPVASAAMMLDAAVTSFAVVFTLFAVVTVVLLVLVVRFTLQRASVARAEWLAGQSEGPGAEDEGETRKRRP